jgi:hypothetical protein
MVTVCGFEQKKWQNILKKNWIVTRVEQVSVSSRGRPRSSKPPDRPVDIRPKKKNGADSKLEPRQFCAEK